jgi:cysteinyl-tRNA synthetase
LRENAREQKNWMEADILRGKIGSLGWQVKDTEAGPIVSKEG